VLLGVRTKLAWWRHLARQRWTYVVGLIGLVVSVATVSFSTLVGTAAAVLAVLTGAIGVVVDRRAWTRARSDLLFQDADPAGREHWVLSGELARAGYVLDRGEPPMIFSPEVNEALRRGADTRYERLRRRPPEEPSGVCAAVILHRKVTSGAVTYNGAKVSLLDDLRLSDGALKRVRLRESRYFDGLITNEFAGRYLRRRGGRVEFSGDSLFLDGQRILPLSQSRASNGVGSSTLALTRDNVVIIGRQGDGSAVSPGLMAPSGSGSADWSDALPSDSLRTFVVRVAERELLEECGLPRRTPCDTTVLAFARVLHRGGKPEFFCFTRLDAEYSEVRVRRQERQLMFEQEALRIDDPDDFRAEVATYFEKHSGELAEILRAHLTLLDQALEAGWSPFD
jgi:8-oxo-dGTP pyrophosphatase MutT (NUDIX family)